MYETASTEPLDLIRQNECEANGSLATSRFQALWNEIERLRAALKPFSDSYVAFVADHIEAFSEATPDEAVLLLDTDHDAHYLRCKVGDFRNAADVLA